MTTNWKRILFITLWALSLLLVPVTILKVTPISSVFEYPVTLANFFQRILGLTAFVLMFWQVILGAYMKKLTEKLGGWVFTFHITEGLILYGIIVLHPTLFVLFNYFAGKGIDPFYVFTQVCILCRNISEFYYTLGRVSFWIVTVAVIAAFFRTSTPFLRVHWKKFHIFNFLAFLLVGFHSIGVGTDVGTFPFSLFHGPALAIVTYIILFKELKIQKFFASLFKNQKSES